MQKLILLIFIFISSLFLAQDTKTASQIESKRMEQYNLKNGVAISGYDPVAYFTEKKSLKGKKNISTTYMGVVYQFYSHANKQLFIKTPSQYEPQYGGYCAYAIGLKDEKVKINPKTFEIRDGKLYLFYNSWGTNTLELWIKEGAQELQKKADINWKKRVN
ncbi:YHS domain protein [Polaribacter sp.]|jgi:YHS domain-containing protein|nr:YHS domain protein [Polaribacter sp.]MDG1245745.1 YHS domain-containing (seleno)protein [Polaribacter sp.]